MKRFSLQLFYAGVVTVAIIINLAAWSGLSLMVDVLYDLAYATVFISAASAIFTGAAIYVALRQSRQLAKAAAAHDLTRATLYASRSIASFRWVFSEVSNTRLKIVFGGPTLDPVGQLRAYKSYRALAERNMLAPTDESLLAMVPLPNQCAHRLGYAFNVLEVFRFEATALSDLEFLKSDDASRTYTLQKLGLRLSRILEYMQVAIEECEKAAQVGAPEPSHIELHGDTDPDYREDDPD